MLRKLVCTMIVLIGTWAGGVRFAEASCAATNIHVLTDPILLPSHVIPVRWWLDPSCPVIETGLLLGTEPAVLTPVGQPIYGQRDRYEQDLAVEESGRYWVVAYARDESGAIVQSSPQMVVIVVPPVFPDGPHGSHGAPPSYAGDDTDFLQPAGEPHYASLRSATTLSQFSAQAVTGGVAAGSFERLVASTQKPEVLSQQAPALVVGGVPFAVNPADVTLALDQLDASFQLLGYPRSGLYSVLCDVRATFFPTSGVSGPRCLSITQPFNNWVGYGEVAGLGVQASIRSSLTYFIPKAPPGKRIQSARLLVFAFRQRSLKLSDIPLSGKMPTAAGVTFCNFFICMGWVTWDFTDEARALAAQGGGPLQLTPDPVPLVDGLASYGLSPAANYPWQHGDENRALTLTFEADCPKELKLKAEPTTIRPQIPFGATLRPGVGVVPSMTMIRATVKTCPSGGNAPPPGPIHVAFEVHPPAANTPQDGGHLHPSTQRPTGTFLKPRLGGGLFNVHCTIETFNEEGMGSCEVPFHSGELSGVETIVGKALDFADAQTSVTIRLLPELKNFMDLPSELYRFVGQIAGRHIDNHWATPATIANTTLMAADYFAANKAVLQINDMSLKWGGLFDIDADWLVPHKSHRQGTSVDVDKLACVSSNPSDPGADCSTTKAISKEVFEAICRNRGGTRADESTHHCEFLE